MLAKLKRNFSIQCKRSHATSRYSTVKLRPLAIAYESLVHLQKVNVTVSTDLVSREVLQSLLQIPQVYSNFIVFAPGLAMFQR